MRETETASHHLGPQLLLDCLCTNAPKSRSRGPAQNGFALMEPPGWLRSLTWNGIVRGRESPGEWGLGLLFQHQHREGPSLHVGSFAAWFPRSGPGACLTFHLHGPSEDGTGHVENGIIDLFPPGWSPWLHSLETAQDFDLLPWVLQGPL